MAPARKEPAGKKGPSARSLNELMELLLKLNAQLREKVSSRERKEEAGTEMEMVIIILNSSPGARKKAVRAEKPRPARDGWIEDLFGDIERGAGGPRNSA